MASMTSHSALRAEQLNERDAHEAFARYLTQPVTSAPAARALAGATASPAVPIPAAISSPISQENRKRRHRAQTSGDSDGETGTGADGGSPLDPEIEAAAWEEGGSAAAAPMEVEGPMGGLISDGSKSPGVSALGTPISIDIRPEVHLEHDRRTLAQPPDHFFNYSVIIVNEAEGRWRSESLKRPVRINNLENDQLELLYNSGRTRAFEIAGERPHAIPDGILIFLHSDQYLHFQTPSANKLAYQLAYIYQERFKAPKLHSVRGRAGDSEGIRNPSPDEASFEEGRGVIPPGSESDNVDQEHLAGPVSRYTTNISNSRIQNTVTHTGPWAKQERRPDQITLMGGQNAKSYIISQLIAGGIGEDGEHIRRSRETYSVTHPDMDNPVPIHIGGRFEWLHIIGSSLGGPNLRGNLVAGTYDANTLMIPFEHAITKLGLEHASRDTPLTIQGTADVLPGTFIGKSITLAVSVGEYQQARTYKTLDPNILTKAAYDREKESLSLEEEASDVAHDDEPEAQSRKKRRGRESSGAAAGGGEPEEGR